MKTTMTTTFVMLIMLTGCTKYPTYSTMGKSSQKPDLEQIVNKNGTLTLQLKGVSYYGNLVFDPVQRFEINPLIHTVTGNAKGVLVAPNGHVVTCVMELQEETKSGSGYCLEEGNGSLLKINLVNM
jgi:hypothetical protein